MKSPGFWRNWPLPKVMVLLSFFLMTLPLGLAQYRLIPAVLVYLFVWNWITQDGRNQPGVRSKYGEFAFVAFWPVLIPFYLLETRGWKRTLAAMAAVFIVVLSAAIMSVTMLFGI